VLVDLDLRIDYLVPFLDETLLNNSIVQSMYTDDSLFIVKDDNGLITNVADIDYSSDSIGILSLISITSASSFMEQATLCNAKESITRMKEIKVRGTKVRKDILNEPLEFYVNQSPRNSNLYEFNRNWYNKMSISERTKCLDFSADNISKIRIVKFNKKGIVISTDHDECSFNGTNLYKGMHYSIAFDVLDSSSNNGSEYFMQKECAVYLKSLEDELITDIIKVINNNEGK